MNPRLIVLGDRDVSYLTHREIDATLALLPSEVEAGWVSTDALDSDKLRAAHGIWLTPGTPYRNDEAAYAAIEHARISGTPFLGTCGGFQYACVSLARSLAGRMNAGHAETDPDSHIVIAPLACALYGEERRVTPVAGTRLAAICGSAPFAGFHFCGYGLTTDGEKLLANSGVTISAHSADGGVEGIELAEHPFFVATLFQPQVGSSESGLVHPLVLTFVESTLACAAADTSETPAGPDTINTGRRLSWQSADPRGS
jgi:CTP synthase (UTP-ammonia lyase)